MNLPNAKVPCTDCPFRKDCLKGWLGSERMAQILGDDSFVCHKITTRQCAGHMLIKGMANGFVRLAKRLGITLKLKGRELVFDTERDCIAHHRMGHYLEKVK